ncbi:hypothetical protein niasHT_013090 [Heterodera trifolii]|uniref:Uncharacterized protein n=1 Tax=Heterodera trifolii TaxID=157864 RepID=A0ABD2L7B1_9BILA
MLLLPLLLMLLLPLFFSSVFVQSVPQRRPVRITPFLYSDALNIAVAGGSVAPLKKESAMFNVPTKFGWDSQAMRQITPFLYSSVNSGQQQERKRFE